MPSSSDPKLEKPRKGFPTGSVCKPCWELKYCPYGSLVEFFPLLPADGNLTDTNIEEIRRLHEELVSRFLSGKITTEDELVGEVERLLYLSPGQWEEAQKYDAKDIECRIWGHVCPVFFSQSGATETKESRRQGRYIRRDIMLQVVRRDNHVCRLCWKYVPDNEVEFDHIIPVSKGGPTTVENLRLLCRSCNRKRSNALGDLIE